MKFLSPIILTLALVAPLAGCRVSTLASPQERIQIESLERQIASVEGDIAATIQEVDAASDALQEAIKAQDAAAVKIAAEALEYQANELEKLEDLYLGKAQELNDLDRRIIEREINPWVTAVVGFIPAPLQPFVPLVLPLAGLAFDRPRKHLAKALRSVLRGSLAEAGLALGKALGYAHSSPATAQAAAEEEIEEARQNLPS